MWRMRFLVAAFVLAVTQSFFVYNVTFAQENSRKVVINEIQTGGLTELLHEDGRREFIELKSQTVETVDLTGLRLQYFSSTREDTLVVGSTPTREIIVLDGLLAGNGYVLFSFEGYLSVADGYFGAGSTATSGLLAKSGGHLRIVDVTGAIVDAVGWGSAKSPETKAVAEIQAGSSIERKIIDTLSVDTDNNFTDFSPLLTPTPQGGSLLEPEIEPEPLPNPSPEIPPCINLRISEIVPNPDGADGGKEYIELHNPTMDIIFLSDCKLSTSGNTKQYIFAEGEFMVPGQYRAFYDSETGLTLPNSAGGEVLLAGTDSDEMVQYPADMKSGHSWSWVNDTWIDSSSITPNALNQLTVVETIAVTDETELAPCPEGKYRSPETNRCRNVQIASAALTPCRSDQIRNLETNRCRSITNVASGLLPCREGQERNPETNRCRSVAGATTTACQEGYERNAETNRCRKIPPVLATSPSVGIQPPKSRLNHAFLGVMSLMVLGYGGYEYRRDISNLIAKLRTRRAVKLAAK